MKNKKRKKSDGRKKCGKLTNIYSLFWCAKTTDKIGEKKNLHLHFEAFVQNGIKLIVYIVDSNYLIAVMLNSKLKLFIELIDHSLVQKPNNKY